MARYRVTCITKRGNHFDPHERISHIGVLAGGGTTRISTDDAIGYILADQHSFYVHRGGHEIEVIVATRNGRAYLKTEDDGVAPDNLLALPECA